MDNFELEIMTTRWCKIDSVVCSYRQGWPLSPYSFQHICHMELGNMINNWRIESNKEIIPDI